MKLLSINKQNISAVEFGNLGNLSKSFITTEYQDVFKGEGKLDGELHRRKLMKQSDLSNCSQDEFQYEWKPNSNKSFTDYLTWRSLPKLTAQQSRYQPSLLLQRKMASWDYALTPSHWTVHWKEMHTHSLQLKMSYQCCQRLESLQC